MEKQKNNTPTEFKNRLRQLRNEAHLTQAQLAKELNYGYTAIANYESGRNQPSIEGLIKLSQVFHVSVDYLLGTTDSRQHFM
ncbi:MAG: helix-turn-helix transcriptional regulator [Epulopiscium sp.]|nr:helix-turn-helix transcriptional regulator [Candidatus Epulonipiscium sp.]